MDLDGYLALLLVTVGMTFGGLLTIYRGFELRKQRQLIEETPTEDVESISMGPSEVTGEVVPREGAAEGITLDGSGDDESDQAGENPLVDEGGACLRSPVGDEQCVIATWKVEEWDEAGDDERWRTVHEAFEAVPFHLDDGTGKLLVEASKEATLSIEGDEFEEPLAEVASTEDPPARIEELLDWHPDLGPSPDPVLEVLDTGHQHGDRRYYEAIIAPGETAYVFGTVQPRDGTRSSVNPENAVIRTASDGEYREPMFVISNRSEADLVDEREWALWRLPAGALLSAAGVAGLVWLLTNPPL